MELLAKATNKTPQISKEDNNIYISGVIIPENPIDIFQMINSIVDEMNKETQNFNVHFSLEYFNTSSARYLYDFFKKQNGNIKIKIVWHYDDDDEEIIESGKEFEEISNLKFEFINQTI